MYLLVLLSAFLAAAVHATPQNLAPTIAAANHSTCNICSTRSIVVTSSTSLPLISYTPSSISFDVAEEDFKHVRLRVETSSTELERAKALYLSADDGELLTGKILANRTTSDFSELKTPDSKIPAADSRNWLVAVSRNILIEGVRLEPCQVNGFQFHPRATKFITVHEGILDWGYLPEIGFPYTINGSLGVLNNLLIPQGNIHYLYNSGCNATIFTSVFSSDDPGTVSIIPELFNLDKVIVNATLGYSQLLNGKDLDGFKNFIPSGVVQKIQQCLDHCNLKGTNITH